MRHARSTMNPAGDALPIAEALVLAAAIRVALRVLRIRRTVRLLGYLGRLGSSEPGRIESCVAAASIAAARAAHPTCLFRSLIAFGLLTRRGWRAAVQIGALRADFVAHAWVTVDGRVVDEAPDREYVPLWRYGPAAPQEL